MATQTAKDREAELGGQLTVWLHGLVDALHDRTIKPLLIAVRAVVVGTFVAVVAVAIAAALVVTLVHVFDEKVFAGRVWATDFLFGAVFLLVGIVLVSRMKPKSDRGR